MAKAGQEVPSKWPPANSAKHMTGAKEKHILYSSEGLQDFPYELGHHSTKRVSSGIKSPCMAQHITWPCTAPATPGQAVHPAPHCKLGSGLSHKGSPQPDQCDRHWSGTWPRPDLGRPTTYPPLPPTPHTPLHRQQGLQRPPLSTGRPRTYEAIPFGWSLCRGAGGRRGWTRGRRPAGRNA